MRRPVVIGLSALIAFGSLAGTAAARSCPTVPGGSQDLPLPMSNVRVIGVSCDVVRAVGVAWWQAREDDKVVYDDAGGTAKVVAAGRTWTVRSRLPASCAGEDACNAAVVNARSGKKRVNWLTSS